MNDAAKPQGFWEMLEEKREAYRAGSSDKGRQLRWYKEWLEKEAESWEKVLAGNGIYSGSTGLRDNVSEMKAVAEKAQEYLDAGPWGELAPLPALEEAYFIASYGYYATAPRIESPIRVPYSMLSQKLTLVTHFGAGDGVWGANIKVLNERGVAYFSFDSGDLVLPKPNPAHTNRVMQWQFDLSFRRPGTHEVVFSLADQEYLRLPITFEYAPEKVKYPMT